MRAAVAEAERGHRVLDHLADRVVREAAVPEQRPQQELAPVVREQQVVQKVGRVAPVALGARRDALARRGLVVGRVADREDPVEPESDERHDVVGLRGLSKDRRSHRGITEARHLLVERQAVDRLVARPVA